MIQADISFRKSATATVLTVARSAVASFQSHGTRRHLKNVAHGSHCCGCAVWRVVLLTWTIRCRVVLPHHHEVPPQPHARAAVSPHCHDNATPHQICSTAIRSCTLFARDQFTLPREVSFDCTDLVTRSFAAIPQQTRCHPATPPKRRATTRHRDDTARLVGPAAQSRASGFQSDALSRAMFQQVRGLLPLPTQLRQTSPCLTFKQLRRARWTLVHPFRLAFCTHPHSRTHATHTLPFVLFAHSFCTHTTAQQPHLFRAFDTAVSSV